MDHDARFLVYKILDQFNSDVKLDLILDFNKKGLRRLANLIKTATFHTFACWRWCTLDFCMDDVWKCLDSLIEHLDFASFETTSKDATDLTNMRKAFGDPEWRQGFLFARWFCRAFGRMLRWGGGYSCEEHQ